MIDLDYYAERLDDPSLLDGAINVLGLTAVPCGGKRQAGSVSFQDSDHVAAAVLLLRDKPGFPNVRCEWPTNFRVCGAVKWGVEIPDVPARDADEAEWLEWDRTLGRLFGYREDVIEAFVTRRWPDGD